MMYKRTEDDDKEQPYKVLCVVDIIRLMKVYVIVMVETKLAERCNITVYIFRRAALVYEGGLSIR